MSVHFYRLLLPYESFTEHHVTSQCCHPGSPLCLLCSVSLGPRFVQFLQPHFSAGKPLSFADLKLQVASSDSCTKSSIWLKSRLHTWTSQHSMKTPEQAVNCHVLLWLIYISQKALQLLIWMISFYRYLLWHHTELCRHTLMQESQDRSLIHKHHGL